jgi:acyl transferase domain-containing protein
MAAGIYRTEPGFRERFDACARALREPLGTDLRHLLFEGGVDEAALRRTDLAQPALFAVEYSLAGLWLDWGVRPRALLGHSVGELAAAVLAGVFELDDACALAAERGRLMQTLPGGAMLGLPLGAAEIEPLLDAGVCLAADNAPGLCTVSGTGEAIDRLAARLEADGVRVRRLHTSHAFHSAMMDPILGAFERRVAAVPRRAPRIPFPSNVTGDWITAEQATDPAYWARQIREPVRFAAGVRRLLADGPQILLEAGPGAATAALARLQADAVAGHRVHTSLPRPQEARADTEHLMDTLGRLWLDGASLDLDAVDARRRSRRVPLPLYPFAEDRHWIDLPGAADATATALAVVSAPSAPAAEPSPETAAAAVAASGDSVLKQVRGVLATLLGIPHLGPHEDFFECGGHSLLAEQAVVRLREHYGVPLPMSSLFEAPTAARLAAAVEHHLAESRPDVDEPGMAALVAEITSMSPEALRAALEREQTHEEAARP